MQNRSYLNIVEYKCPLYIVYKIRILASSYLNIVEYKCLTSYFYFYFVPSSYLNIVEYKCFFIYASH